MQAQALISSLTITSAMLVLAVTMAPCSADDTPRFKITTKRANDRVAVKSENDTALFDIRSPSGVGSATIERTAVQWPSKVVVQLRLSGLESFQLATDKLRLEASVSSQDGDVRLWKDGKEDALLNSKSAYWMEIRRKDSDGKQTKAMPLKDGYFEMQLPNKLFEGNPKLIALNWIDFYRN